MLTTRQQRIKRVFDLFVSIMLFPIVIVPVILLSVLASLSTRQNGIFVQTRIGQNGLPFRLYKVRSLKGCDHDNFAEMKASETSFGNWIRKTKLDELPQIFNVLWGDMSWVGPRPDIPGYADVLEGEDRVILSVRPGITGPATLKYKNEDALLEKQKNPQEYNDTIIWPDKVEINKLYVAQWSLKKDISYLWASVFN